MKRKAFFMPLYQDSKEESIIIYQQNRQKKSGSIHSDK
jgi:hypothetical protein